MIQWGHLWTPVHLTVVQVALLGYQVNAHTQVSKSPFLHPKKENTEHLTGLLGELREQCMENARHTTRCVANLHHRLPPPPPQTFTFVSLLCHGRGEWSQYDSSKWKPTIGYSLEVQSPAVLRSGVYLRWVLDLPSLLCFVFAALPPKKSFIFMQNEKACQSISLKQGNSMDV